jgi:hypothetical protein
MGTDRGDESHRDSIKPAKKEPQSVRAIHPEPAKTKASQKIETLDELKNAYFAKM